MGTSCSDGDYCNGFETCDGAGSCIAGLAPSVDDGNPCTGDRCDPQTGVWNDPKPAGSSCSDGNVCNGAEVCDGAGMCLAASPPVLDDGNPCTTDACAQPPGVTHVPVSAGTPCSDGNACNGAEMCDAVGSCVRGVAPIVDDGNPCTVDLCDPIGGVVHESVASGTSCSDGNVCNGDEVCDLAGQCRPGFPLEVDDGNPCTTDTCDPVAGLAHPPSAAGMPCGAAAGRCASSCDGSGACLAGVAAPRGTPCSPGATCGAVCDGVSGSCQPLE